MTPESKQDLCRAIAEAEGHEVYHASTGIWYRTTAANTGFAVLLPAYLTDPAETVRVLEALCEGYNNEVRLIDEGKGAYSVEVYRWDEATDADIEIEALNKWGETSAIAVAQAYLAMLLAKKEDV